MGAANDLGLSKKGPLWEVPAAIAEGIRAQSISGQHKAYRQLAQAVFAAEHHGQPPAATGDLAAKGFELVPDVLPPDQCRALSGRIGEWLDRSGGGAHALPDERIYHFKRDLTNRVVPIDHEVLRAALPTVRRVLSRGLTSHCEAFLGCHFKINSIRLFRSVPNDNPLVSFRWHVDAAPPGQIHVMVYLTDAGPDGAGGCTEFLPRGLTPRVNRSGYAYARIEDRVLELDQLDGGDDLLPLVERPLPRAGDALVFTPGTAFHRGIPPRDGFRDALLLVLLPALDPWAVSLAVHGTDIWRDRGHGYLPVDVDPIAP
jgi:hypothetical protein